MLKNKTALSLSPLALLTLAACGGAKLGGGTTALVTQTGKVTNGPLQDAVAYLEYGAVGSADYGSYTAGVDVIGTANGGMTSNTGAYSIVAKAGSDSYTLMADTTAQTLDTVSGVAYGAGTTFKAPVGSSGMNPATTLVTGILEDTSNTLTATEAAQQVAVALGFVDASGDVSVNFLTYDPYADQTSMTTAEKQLALDVTLTTNKVMTIVKTMAAAAVEAGASVNGAAAAAMQGVVELVQTKMTAIKDNAPGGSSAGLKSATEMVLNFDLATDVGLLNDNIQAEMVVLNNKATETVNTAAFVLASDGSIAAINNVIASIQTITLANKDVEGSTLMDKLQSINLLVADVKKEAALVTTAEAAGLTHTIGLDFTLASNITTALSNPAPTDLLLSGSTTTDTTYSASSAETVTVPEGMSLVVGTVTVTDKGVGTSDGATTPTWTYATDTATFEIVAGGDGASFNIDASTGVLSFVATPYHETKSTYSVSVQVTDGASKSYVETFTVAVEDGPESGAFGISSDVVSWTDYDPTGAAALYNQLATTTTGSNVTFGDVVPLMLNSQNMINLTDGNTLTTGVSPTLSFKLDTVPVGSSAATVTATITDGTYTAGTAAVAADGATAAVAAVAGAWSTDGTPEAGEDQISVTVQVQYTGNADGTASITAIAATATGAYNKGDGTSSTFNISNMDTDVFAITAGTEVTPASLDVKMSALYTAFVTGAGNANMIVDGEYHLNIATTLPLENAANETVTNFSGKVELVDSSVSTVIGTNGADTLVGTVNAEIFALGFDTDTVTTGDGADLIVLSSTEGRQLANIDTVTDFANNTDKFIMDDFEFADLTIEAASNNADTLVSLTVNGSNPTGNGEYLMLISDVAVGFINAGDFISDIA